MRTLSSLILLVALSLLPNTGRAQSVVVEPGGGCSATSVQTHPNECFATISIARLVMPIYFMPSARMKLTGAASWMPAIPLSSFMRGVR